MSMQATVSHLALIGFVAATLGAASAQNSQPRTGSDTSSRDLKVAVTQPKEAMQDLRTAVRELRDASVLLLNQKEQSTARDKAVNSAQAAIMNVQRAMAQLPAQMRISDPKIREAKDWPAAAARLDKASIALESAVTALEKQGSGSSNASAISNVRKAMDDVEGALLAMPDWRPGPN